jgi:hypothetical protein
MMVARQLDHPELSRPVRRLHLLADCTAFIENPNFASSQDQISSSVNVNNLRLFVDAIDWAPPDITDTNVADLLSLATGFGFSRFLEQITAHSHKFPVPRSTTWHGEDVHHLFANQPGTISPSRDQTIMNFTCSLRELVHARSPEVGKASQSLMDHHPRIIPTMRRKAFQNSEIEAEIEALATESQNLKKENEILQTAIRITVTENRKMKIIIKVF